MVLVSALDQRQHPFTLSFLDKNLELSFCAIHSRNMLSQVRIALIIAATLYLLYSILDYVVLAEGQWFATVIRFVVVLPIFVLGYLATYKNYFRKRMQQLVMVVIFLAGIGLAFIALSYDLLATDLYLFGPIFPVFWAFVFSGLRFIYALLVSILLIVSYNLIYFALGDFSLPFILTYDFFLLTALVIGGLGGYTIERYYRRDFINQKLIAAEKLENERLLLNILPRQIANELKRSHGTIARDYEQITVLFADLVEFSRLSQDHAAKEVVEILNDIFCLFDELTEKYGLEKIKTIGDAYMVTSNLQQADVEAPKKIAEFALAISAALIQYNAEQHHNIKLRIGIHTGPAVAGVIGVKKFVYDVWGTTVNIASRMESTCPVGSIQVSQSSYELLKMDYDFIARGDIEMKGFGPLPTYLLTGTKANEKF